MTYTKKRKPALGDIVAIQLESGRFAAGKIVYISTEFKDLIGLLLLDSVFRTAEHIAKRERTVWLSKPVCTSILIVKRGLWPIVDHESTDDRELALTERVVAGAVLVGDKLQREATDEDCRRLPRMAAAGVDAATTMISRLVERAGES